MNLTVGTRGGGEGSFTVDTPDKRHSARRSRPRRPRWPRQQWAPHAVRREGHWRGLSVPDPGLAVRKTLDKYEPRGSLTATLHTVTVIKRRGQLDKLSRPRGAHRTVTKWGVGSWNPHRTFGENQGDASEAWLLLSGHAATLVCDLGRSHHTHVRGPWVWGPRRLSARPSGVC